MLFMKKMWVIVLHYLRQKLSHNKGLILIVFGILMAFFLLPSLGEKNARIEVELTGDPNSIFQIFWAGKNWIGRSQGYDEKRSDSVRIRKNRVHYAFMLPDLNSITRLRIDPVKNPSKVIIKRIVITQMGYKPILFEMVEDFKSLIPLRDIEKIKHQYHGLEIISSGTDPQLEVSIYPQFSYSRYGHEFMSQTYSNLKNRSELLGLELIPLIFLLIDVLLLLSISASFLIKIGYKFENAAETFLATGIVFLSCIVLTVILLGSLFLLSWVNILFAHLALWLSIHIFFRNSKENYNYLEALENLLKLLGSILKPFTSLFQKENWRKNKIFETVMLITIIIILIFYFIPAIFTLPLNYDANNYRLSRIGYWLQEMNIYHFNALDERQIYMAINVDLVMLWITSFFHKGFPLVHLVQFLGGLLCCAATYAIGRIIRFSRFWGLAAVLFFLGIPNAVCQFFTSQADMFTSGCLVAGLFFMFKALSQKRIIFFALFGAGLGLAVGAKGIVFFWGPGLLLWFLCQLILSRPGWVTLSKGLFVAVVVAIIIGGFNYTLNLIEYENPLAPKKSVSSNIFIKEPGLSNKESTILRASALFWQIFEPSSNLGLFHPLTNTLFQSIENRIVKNIEGWKAPFVRRFKKAAIWLRKVKLSEDYLSFGFLPFFLTVVGGLTGIFVAIRSKDVVAAQVTFMFFSVLLYMLFFPYVRAWSVHQYRYAVMLTPLMSVISIFGFYYVFQHFNFFAIRWSVIVVLLMVLICQGYMSFLISLKSRNHGWRAVCKLRSVPNYHFYWRDTNTLVERFSDRSYKIGLLVSKGPWSALFFRRQPRHKITYLSENPPKYIDENYFAKNDIEVMISQNLSGIKLSGQFNLYQCHYGSLLAIVPQSVNPDLQPWISKKGRWRDLWTKPEGSFQIGNWDKQFIKLLLNNPAPFKRNIILSTSKEKQEFTLPPNQKTSKLTKLKVKANDEISWKISPIYKPWKYSNTLDSRQLGIKLKPLRSD